MNFIDVITKHVIAMLTFLCLVSRSHQSLQDSCFESQHCRTRDLVEEMMYHAHTS
jgi:hypothetical protein